MTGDNRRAPIAVAAGLLALFGVVAWKYSSRNEKDGDKVGRREFARRYAEQLRIARERGVAAATEHQGSDVDEGDVAEARVRVFYGTESGNAESLAKGLVMTLRDRGVTTALINPEAHHLAAGYFADFARSGSSSGITPVALFVVATSGEGEPTINFMSALRDLKDSVAAAASAVAQTPKRPFDGLHYAVFALGDSSYKYYCRAGVQTNTALKAGGGTELHRVVLGDAKYGAQEDLFDEWQDHILVSLVRKCGLIVGEGTLLPPQPQLTFRELKLGDVPTSGTAAPNSITTGGCLPPLSSSSSADAVPVFPLPPHGIMEPSIYNPAQVPLTSKVRLTEPRASDGSCIYRFAFDTENAHITFQAGDHLGIFPANPPEIVERCAKMLKLTEEQLSTTIELCATVISRGQPVLRSTLPARVPLRDVLKWYIDLCGKPRKSTLRVIAKYCRDVAERDAFLASLKPREENEDSGGDNDDEGDAKNQKKGASAAVSEPMRTVLDYMERFSSCLCIPIGHFLEVMPRIQPRYYSLASDPLSHNHVVEVLVRVQPDGLAGSYLVHQVEEGDSVYGFVRGSTFHLPAKIQGRPMLMIGPGTGAAAMVGLCYRREALMRKQPSATYGPCVFFFGAQHQVKEYFVREEVERWARSPAEMAALDAAPSGLASHAALAARHSRGSGSRGFLSSSVITLLECAFSRDTSEKYYVTHLINKHKDLVYEILTAKGEGGLVYVSGDAASMAKDVNKALEGVLQEKGGMTRMAAIAFLSTMEQGRRFLKDLY